MFVAAEPVFVKGLDRTPDVQAGFYLPFCSATEVECVTLRVTAATFYRAYLNGKFLAHGPARTAHGMTRVDEIDLTVYLREGQNHLAIEVVGYNLDCIYTTGDSSFVLAEVVADGRVLAATNASGRALHLTQRLAAERFSHARCMGEIYRLDAGYFDWQIGRFEGATLHECERVTGPKQLLPRGMPQSDYRLHRSTRLIACHSHEPDADAVVAPIAPLEHGAYLDYIATLTEKPATECAMERVLPFRGRMTTSPAFVAAISDLFAPSSIDLDFGELQSGFICIDVETRAAATIDLVFVEHLSASGDIEPRGGDMNGVIRLHLPAGRTRFQAFEPHCVRYLRIIARNTSGMTIHSAGVIDYSYPDRTTGTFVCSDGDLNRIYDAARHTLRLNTLDVFMDCPGRERAGWLCDSLFSGRAMQVLFGDLSVERAMLENFLHAPESEEFPGYFPEAYPGRKISGGNFIPNWSMFLGIELCEYVRRSGDTDFADAFRARIERLIAGIERSANAHGLLETLPGFTFLDWSDANKNEFKNPISTPTNALYAFMLDQLSTLYAREDWKTRAAVIRETLRNVLPVDGPMPDALHHDEERLVPAEKASEAAQHYLFWTGAADANGAANRWWQRLLTDYGPAGTKPDHALLAPSNVFIGLYLRLDLLSLQGEHDRLLSEMRTLFLPMLARGPGTLWEHLRLEGSVCHGFASHAAVWLVRDILGIGMPDAIEKTIQIAPHPAGLAWASGTILVENKPVSLEWRLSASTFAVRATFPPGYQATVHLPEVAKRFEKCRVNGASIDRTALAASTFNGTIDLELVSA